MMPVIAIAGGSGKLGRTIVDAILNHGKHQVVVLVRQGSESRTKDLGAPALELDYSNAEAIRDVLQSNDIGTFISTLDTIAGADLEQALIKAAELSNTTERFIFSSWGIKYTSEVTAIFPMAAGKVAALQLLKASSLEFTTVINGFFLDYYTGPKIPSNLGSFPAVVDMANNAAALPGSGEVPVAFTHTSDVARFVISLLDLPTWAPELYVTGEKLTWKEFLALAEEAKGVKFNVQFDALETLQQNQATELPGYKYLYPFFPKQMLLSYVATFGIMFEKGFFDIEVPAEQGGAEARSVGDLLKHAWQ